MVIFQPRANLRLFRCIAKRLLSHVYKRQNPGDCFRGLLPIVLYRFRISHLSNENNVAFHGGWCIPFPLSFSLLPNIPGRAFHLPEIPGRNIDTFRISFRGVDYPGRIRSAYSGLYPGNYFLLSCFCALIVTH